MCLEVVGVRSISPNSCIRASNIPLYDGTLTLKSLPCVFQNPISLCSFCTSLQIVLYCLQLAGSQSCPSQCAHLHPTLCFESCPLFLSKAVIELLVAFSGHISRRCSMRQRAAIDLRVCAMHSLMGGAFKCSGHGTSRFRTFADQLVTWVYSQACYGWVGITSACMPHLQRLVAFQSLSYGSTTVSCELIPAEVQFRKMRVVREALAQCTC